MADFPSLLRSAKSAEANSACLCGPILTHTRQFSLAVLIPDTPVMANSESPNGLARSSSGSLFPVSTQRVSSSLASCFETEDETRANRLGPARARDTPRREKTAPGLNRWTAEVDDGLGRGRLRELMVLQSNFGGGFMASPDSLAPVCSDSLLPLL